MSYFNRFFSIRFTKMLMIIALFGLLIVAIWLLGPFTGFGEARPLASVEARVILTLLAILCLSVFWFNLPAFIMIVATVCVMIWVAGPFLFLGDRYPLADVLARIIVISCILFMATLYGIWKLLLALRNNPKLRDRIFNKKEVSQDDLSDVMLVIREAAKYIKKISKASNFFQRFFRPHKMFYKLPWYMVIGTQSAGKTSLILSSGQDFPRPEQLNCIGKETPPTKNCDCWFANDALFIDTAGKYISQPQENTSEWGGILKAIKKYRPVKSLNGIIVTLSAADIMGRSKAEIFDLSAKIRARIDEARNVLGVHFPVYVLLTKMDQLSGFSEYFRMLTEQEREQVWGVSFPYGKQISTSVPELRELISEELALLENRLEKNMTVRQLEEYENADRKKMYAFPQDFRMLTLSVTDLLQNIFFASRYDETQRYSSLRGVYFTSSHQPGDFSLVNDNTVVQKWKNFVSDSQNGNQFHTTTVDETNVFLVGDVSYGRQYFLNKLFADIIIKDADLVRHNIKVETKYRFQNLVGHLLILIVALFLLSGLYESYHNNDAYMKSFDEKVVRLEKEVNTYQKKADNSMLPVLFNLAQYLPEYKGLNVSNPPLNYRYGLYIGQEMNKESDHLYHYFLKRLLFPMIENHAHQALEKAVYNKNSADIYEKLKVYLMLSGQGEFDRDFIVAQITKEWDNDGKIRPYEERSLFVAHLKELFMQPEWRRFGQSADPDLVAQARALLGQNPVDSRLYERVKLMLLPDAPEPLTLNKMTEEQAGQVFKVIDTDLEGNGINGLFTYEGYHQVFKKKLGGLLEKLYKEDSWIMGSEAKGEESATTFLQEHRRPGFSDERKDALTKMYLQEYTSVWERFLKKIRINSEGLESEKNTPGLSFDIYMMRTLVSSNSPLIKLAQAAVAETTLSEQKESLLPEKFPSGTSSPLVEAASKLNLALAAHEKKMLREGVDNHFSSLREFVRGNGMPVEQAANEAVSAGTQLNKVMNVLNEQHTFLVISESAIKNGELPLISEAAQKLNAESAIWPDPFRHIVAPLLEGALSRVNAQIFSSANKAISSTLGDICRNTLEGRYPFAASAEEVSIRDFEKFFSADGLVESYFKENLADKVDIRKRPWRYLNDSENVNSTPLALFEEAAAIRKAFFQDEGKKLSLNLAVSVPYMDPKITQLNLKVDGKRIGYSHGPVVQTAVKWPGSLVGTGVNMSVRPATNTAKNGVTATGPWGLLRWIESADSINVSVSGDPIFTFNQDNRKVDLAISGLMSNDELIVNLLTDFRCPGLY